LLSEVWGYADGSGPRTVDTHVANLLAKTGATTRAELRGWAAVGP
ncbi:MAG: hypothetical protein QOK35_1395, partial [Pseudonocardiales bacterium]|nr:hypothetical protein [Pseudonocardiales bacterium]